MTYRMGLVTEYKHSIPGAGNTHIDLISAFCTLEASEWKRVARSV